MLVRSPTLTNRLSASTVNGSRPASRIAGGRRGGRTRLGALDRGRDRLDVLRGGAAAAADQVDQAGGGELAEHGGHLVGRLVVLAELVGQPGVGVGGDEAVGDPGQLGDVGPQLGRAQRAVEADDERPDVADAVPERLGGLAREGAAAGVGDRAGDPDRPAPALLLEERLQREDRGLGVEGVEDRLDQQQVGAAVDQPAGLLEVGRDELVEAGVAGAGVVDVRGDRGRLVGGARASRPRTAGARSVATASAASRASAAAARFIS